jgi:outer membrane protein OmpA-like peptidoglycan-associated protein
MGYPINTTDDDVFFVPTADEKHAFYSSAKLGGYGDQDIYFITIIERKKRLASLKCAVFETFTYKPLDAKVEIKDQKTGEVISIISTDEKTGSFYTTLPIGRKFELTATSDGYLPQTEVVETSDKLDNQEVDKAILLKKNPIASVQVVIENKTISLNERIVLDNVFFDFDKATLTDESTTTLVQVVDVLTKNPTIKVEISGHTDNVGAAIYNKKLSLDRAKTVVDFLVKKGIDKTRLTSVGYGAERPIASNKSDMGRAKNRRTEFKIISTY